MRQNDGIKLDSFIEIDKDIKIILKIYIKKSIYLLHYPKGIEICETREIIRNITEDNYTIEHFCDSNNGSSEGPLINIKNNKVIGIHKGFNGKINLGTILREPIEKFFEQLSNIIQINNVMNQDKQQKLYNNNNSYQTTNNNEDLNEINENIKQYKIKNSVDEI